MYVVVCVGISRLQLEDWSAGRGVQLHHRLHGQGPVDEVGRLVIHVLQVHDHPLPLGI